MHSLGGHMETRNRNWKQKWAHKTCQSPVQCLLHDWQVLCFVITCVSCLGLHIQCDWLVLAWQAMLQSSLVHVRILLGRPTAAERLHFHFISILFPFPAFPYSWHGGHVLVCKLPSLRWYDEIPREFPRDFTWGFVEKWVPCEQLHQNLKYIFLKPLWVTPPYFLIHTNIICRCHWVQCVLQWLLASTRGDAHMQFVDA